MEVHLPQNPGAVVIGISKDKDGQIVVYAYCDEDHADYQARGNSRRATPKRLRVEYPWDTTTHDHVLRLVEQVAAEAYAKGAVKVMNSSTVDFWKEAIS